MCAGRPLHPCCTAYLVIPLLHCAPRASPLHIYADPSIPRTTALCMQVTPSLYCVCQRSPTQFPSHRLPCRTKRWALLVPQAVLPYPVGCRQEVNAGGRRGKPWSPSCAATGIIGRSSGCVGAPGGRCLTRYKSHVAHGPSVGQPCFRIHFLLLPLESCQVLVSRPITVKL